MPTLAGIPLTPETINRQKRHARAMLFMAPEMIITVIPVVALFVYSLVAGKNEYLPVVAYLKQNLAIYHACVAVMVVAGVPFLYGFLLMFLGDIKVSVDRIRTDRNMRKFAPDYAYKHPPGHVAIVVFSIAVFVIAVASLIWGMFFA